MLIKFILVSDFKEETVILFQPEEFANDVNRQQQVLEVALELLQELQPNLEGAVREAALEAIIFRIVDVMFPPHPE